MMPRIMYVELKDGHGDRGPARIGRVRFSRTGVTVYYRDLELQRCRGIAGNYRDAATGEEYWVSGCKRNGQDRHWAGGGPVFVDEDVRAEYWTEIRGLPHRKDDPIA